jgi:hypothetical protein
MLIGPTVPVAEAFHDPQIESLMSLKRKVAGALPPAVLNVAVHRDLYLSSIMKRDSRPVALIFGNCQAEALRRIMVTHQGFAETYQVLRIPAVHEISARELALIENRLPDVEVFIGQQVKSDYRGMRLGTDQLIDRLSPNAQALRYPVAYFEGMFPFHVYVNRPGDPNGTSAPITDYHDLRILYAAGQGWDVPTTLRRLGELRLDPDWIRDNAEHSLQELAKRETNLTARLSELIRKNPTTSFNTINHPVNDLITEVARQLLEHLGYSDADTVLDSKQVYLDHMEAPREPQILRALGAEPTPEDHTDWLTSAGWFSPAEVVAAHLKQYADEPDLLPAGLAKHQARLGALGAMWN